MLRLSPSDFAFLYEQCKRCFYMKVVRNIKPPSMPMASIFKKIEALQMKFYDGRRTSELLPALPPGVFRCAERAVESEPRDGWYVYGKIDSLIEFDDGSWGILDFKTTVISPDKGALYGRQLHAYAHAFENPSTAPRVIKGEAPRLGPISKIGLLCFEPVELTLEERGRQVYIGDVQWIEIPRDREKFLSFVREAVDALQKEPPPPAPDCDWCAYAATMKSDMTTLKVEVVSCPQCGAAMRQRNGKFGSFWGCSRYPDCRGTRQVTAPSPASS